MGIEFELKFQATPEQLAAMDQACVGSRQVIRMQTAYYDTPNADLTRLHYTLRRRMENDTSVCTLKLPAAGSARMEFEVEKDSIQDAIPELCKLSGVPDLEALLSRGVTAICGARFTRIAKTVTLADAEVELALDQGVLTGGSKTLDLCEAEVELKSGSRDAAIAYASQLALAYGLTPQPYSKFRRARSLAEGE